MHIALLHYHLHPGGVTRIIGSQVQGLLETEGVQQLKVLCGNNIAHTALSGVPIEEIASLQYMQAGAQETDYGEESSRIMTRITEHAKDFILHCHNPNLGKNPALTLAVFRLAQAGYRIINHCHDFAEDRPFNMKALQAMINHTGLQVGEVLYPDLPNYHFVALNTFDYNRILQAHIPPNRVHLIPNPVSLREYNMEDSKQDLRLKIISQLALDPDKKIITYPVRAIRRKNIGEFILLGTLFERTCQFLITQAPKNPEELPGYNRWKDFCRKHKIRIKFEAGDIVNHEELIGITDFCLTTSKREGFGMVFLEPWLAGTPVSGRDLPGITGDLRSYGLEFPGLYKHILVESRTGVCDFTELDQEGQEDCIVRIHRFTYEKVKISRLNPFLESLFTVIEPEMIRKNRQIILNQFSVANYGKRLLELYKSLPR